VKEVNAKTALEAVRKSFVDSLASDTALSSERDSGPRDARRRPARPRQRKEQAGAPGSASRLSGPTCRPGPRLETADDLESRPPAETGERVAQGFLPPDRCAGFSTRLLPAGELACSVARISPARSSRQAPRTDLESHDFAIQSQPR
jgi:hypothetical protein